MATAQYDVIGIGNAIVDVLAQTDEDFLARHGLSKGGEAMRLRSARLHPAEGGRQRDMGVVLRPSVDAGAAAGAVLHGTHGAGVGTTSSVFTP